MSNYDEEQNDQLKDKGNEQPPLFDEKNSGGFFA